MSSFIKENSIVLSLCGLFFLIGLARLNDLSLYTDSTRYVIWGNSVAHAKGFVDNTQPEPDYFVVNAPLLAVLLAPIEVPFPLSVNAAKVWILVWGTAALLLFSIWITRRIGKTPALIATAFLAFNPLMVVMSTEILSEAPFFVFLFACFIYLDEIAENREISTKGAIILIVAMTVVPLLREVGAALVLAGTLVLLPRKRIKLALAVLIGATALFGLWTVRNLVWIGAPPSSQTGNMQFILQHFVTPAKAPLLSELTTRFWLNLKTYSVPLAGTLLYPFPSTLIVMPTGLFVAVSKLLSVGETVIVGVSTLFTLTGIILDVRSSRSATTRLLFLIVYLVIILLYPVQDIRFLLPILPFSLFYIVRTSVWLAHRFRLVSPPLRRNLAVSFALFLLIPNLLCILEVLRTNLSYANSPEAFSEQIERNYTNPGFFLHPWRLLGDWINKNLPPKTIIASPAKEIVPFVGDRKVLELNRPVPLPLFEQYLRDYQVEYVLAPTIWEDLRAYQFVMMESQRLWFEPLHQFAHLNLFRVHSRLMESDKRTQARSLALDTTKASSLLLIGRLHLMNEQYVEAIQLLERAHRLAPSQAEVTYQLLSAHAISGDFNRAIQLAQTLFSQPQSSSYIPSTQLQLHAMDLMNQAAQSQNIQQRALLTYEASSVYWSLGFRERAYAILKDVLEKDQSYFVGLLWGWHHAIQLKDTAQAQVYLKRLETIDRQNRVVERFLAMTALADSLRQSSDSTRRSQLHLSIAHSYEDIELHEEALDEVERALADEPINVDAWLYYGELFKQKHKNRAASKAYDQVLTIDPKNATALTKLKDR